MLQGVAPGDALPYRFTRVIHSMLDQLSTQTAIFALLLLVFCAFFTWFALRLAAYCRAAVDFVTNQNKNSVSLRRIAEVESTLTELLDAYTSLLESHKKLRSRIGMRKVREARKDEPESGPVPTNEAEKAAYKARIRKQLQREGRL